MRESLSLKMRQIESMHSMMNVSCLSVAFFLVFDIICLGVNTFINSYFSQTPLDSAVLYGVLFLGILISIFREQKINCRMLLLLISILLVFFISLLFNIENLQYITLQNVYYIFIGMIMAVILSNIRCFDKIIDELYFMVPFAILCGLIHLICERGSNDSKWVSDMNSAYAMLVPVLFAIELSFRKKWMWFFAILGTMITCLYGSRGPILIIAIYLAFSIIKHAKSIGSKIVVSVAGILILYFLLSGSYLGVLQQLDKYLRSKNIVLASLNKILYYNDKSNGRVDVYSQAFAMISANPLWGCGIFGDRIFAAYSHNLFVELLLDFGIPFGFFFVCFIIVNVVKTIVVARKKLGEDGFVFVVIIFLAVYGQLMVSSSYLQYPLFFASMGLFYARRRMQ